jgi:hypothetical protein
MPPAAAVAAAAGNRIGRYSSFDWLTANESRMIERSSEGLAPASAHYRGPPTWVAVSARVVDLTETDDEDRQRTVSLTRDVVTPVRSV